jgi:hypothetical protein
MWNSMPRQQTLTLYDLPFPAASPSAMALGHLKHKPTIRINLCCFSPVDDGNFELNEGQLLSVPQDLAAFYSALFPFTSFNSRN